MKKLSYILIALIISHISISAQTEKIKGNREVTIKQTNIDGFHTILVDGKFDIEVTYNNEPSVQIETDDNLHKVVQFSVTDSVLSFKQSMRITSKKRLNIIVNYSDALRHIKTRDNGEIRSLTSMDLTNATLEMEDNSKAYLNIKANYFEYKGTGKSKTRLNITGDSLAVDLTDNVKLEAQLNCKAVTFNLNQRANVSAEGNTNTIDIKQNNSSNFNSSKFTVDEVNVTIKDNSKHTINCNKSIVINASGDSELYLYGSPKITIDTFEDTAKLQKKKRK